MTKDQTKGSHPTENVQAASFGAKLKAAREALGLERSDVAAQLRLGEKVILMIEKNAYPPELPVTFLRGYLKSYGKLVHIPEFEITNALENLKHKSGHQPTAFKYQQNVVATFSGHYFMQFFTYLILFTLLSLAGVWWYTHNKFAFQANAEKTISRITNVFSARRDINSKTETVKLLADNQSQPKLSEEINSGIMPQELISDQNLDNGTMPKGLDKNYN